MNSSPDCSVRPQTIVEIKRMRLDAARIAQMIQTEASSFFASRSAAAHARGALQVIIMEKRKTYVESMTAYLNDRIRELNKVKDELAQENRWIAMSNQRIAELAKKEKLVKMQGTASTARARNNLRHRCACLPQRGQEAPDRCWQLAKLCHFQDPEADDRAAGQDQEDPGTLAAIVCWAFRVLNRLARRATSRARRRAVPRAPPSRRRSNLLTK